MKKKEKKENTSAQVKSYEEFLGVLRMKQVR